MPSAWAINEDAGSPEYAAQELRRIAAMTLWPGVSHRFGARQGVRPGGGAVVTVSGTTWTQHDLTAVVYPGVTSISGPYTVEKAAESGSLNPADGSNPRVDALDLQVQDDDEDASGERRPRVVYVPGNPASSPSAPALTPNSLRLATILVPAGGSPAPSVASLAPFTVAAGGILPVLDAAGYPANGLYEGMYLDDRDLGGLVRRGAAAWQQVAHPAWGRGLVSFATNAAQVEIASGSSATLITDSTVPLLTGRRYRAEASVIVNRSTGSGSAFARTEITVSGGVGIVARGAAETINSTISRSEGVPTIGPPFIVPSSGSYVVQLVGRSSSNKGINFGGATDPPEFPMYVAIYDVGAA